jgi:hypothetical protein
MVGEKPRLCPLFPRERAFLSLMVFPGRSTAFFPEVRGRYFIRALMVHPVFGLGRFSA